MVSESYAVFLSYNGDDKEAVEKLAVYLDDQAKLRPWFDQWSLIPGEPWVRNLERGIKASGTCAVIVGRSGTGSWQRPEVEAALRQQVQRPEFRVIPVLLPDAPQDVELPAFVDGNNWVAFRQGLDDEAALWRLECGIRGIAPGRGRPVSAPPAPEPPPPVACEPSDIGDGRIAVKPAARTANIFISYRHQKPDSVLAQAFADALKEAGHEVFIDTNLRWGADWVQGIRDALERADYLLLLLSEESGSSEMVVKEVQIARALARQQAGRPAILPVRLRLPFTEALPYQLAISLHNIHQESWSGPEDTPRIMGRLLATVAESSVWPREQGLAPDAGGVKATRPLPQFDPRSVIIPGGSVETNSRFYITREADEEVFNAVQRPRGLVTVRGPRQSGKTSLAMGMYASVNYAESRLRAAFIDFQSFKAKEFKSLDSIWQAIAGRLAQQLRVRSPGATQWVDYDNSCSDFMSDTVFGDDDTPLLICLDEVDSVFNSPIKNEFFSSVRYFFNRGAWDPCWKRVRWLLSTSSEPSFFIENMSMSPFNIGLRVELSTFTPTEVETFAGRHGLTMTEAETARIMEYVGGRPFLVHLILYQLARKPATGDEEIFDTRLASRGLFRDHLHSYLVHFQRYPTLATAMKRVIAGEGCDDAKLADRLDAAGLVRRDDSLRVVPLCRLYAEFFGSELK